MAVVLVGSGGYIGREFASRLTFSQTNYLAIENRQVFDSLQEDFWRNLQDGTTVIWAAGQANRLQKILTPDEVKSETLRFEKFIKDISDSNASSIRVLFMSSGGAIYKDFTSPPSETDEHTSTNRYGILKIHMENLLLKYGINHASLRLGNVYGPKIDNQFGVIAEWARSIRDGREIQITETLQAQRDYIHISDVIDFSSLLLNSTFVGPINVATGTSTSLAQIIDLLKINHPDLSINLNNLKEGSVRNSSQGSLDVNLALKTFCWRHKVRLNDGIREILTYPK